MILFRMIEKLPSLMANISFIVFYYYFYNWGYSFSALETMFDYIWPGVLLGACTVFTFNLVYFLIYYFDPVILRQYKVSQEDWPWISRPNWWNKNKNKIYSKYVSLVYNLKAESLFFKNLTIGTSYLEYLILELFSIERKYAIFVDFRFQILCSSLQQCGTLCS